MENILKGEQGTIDNKSFVCEQCGETTPSQYESEIQGVCQDCYARELDKIPFGVSKNEMPKLKGEADENKPLEKPIRVRKVYIRREWGARSNGDVFAFTTDVKVGDIYDLLQIVVSGTSMFINVGVPAGTSEAKCHQIARQYVKERVDHKRIKEMNEFLELGNKWGWD